MHVGAQSGGGTSEKDYLNVLKMYLFICAMKHFNRCGENFEVRKEKSPPTLTSVLELIRQHTSSGGIR